MSMQFHNRMSAKFHGKDFSKKLSNSQFARRSAAMMAIESLESRLLFSDAPLIGSSGNVIKGVEGASSGFPLMGTFVDDNTSATSATYTGGGGSVVVNWGDGSSPQTLSSSNLVAISTASSSETWGIAALHTYSERGTYAYTITVTESGGAAAIVSGEAVVADASLTLQSVATVTPSTGIPIDTNIIAFSDGNPTALATNFTTTIDWGDGSPPSDGLVTQPGGIGTAFFVVGRHAYANPGTYTTQVTVSDGESTLDIPVIASVTDSPLSGSAQDIASTASSSTGNVVLATIDDPNLLATDSSLTAVVSSWGDGTPASPVTVPISLVGGTSSDNIFQVTGSHTYAGAGPYNYAITVTTIGGQVLDLTGTATVAAASAPSTNVIASSVLTPIHTLRPAGSTGMIPVATFTDSAAESLNHYLATINWGDGSSSTGAITYSNGVFTVDGSKSYGSAGDYSPIVTIQKDSLPPQSVTDTDTVDVTITPHIATDAGLTFNGVAGSAVSATLADFTAVHASNPAKYYTARINWGDGKSSKIARVVRTSSGHFTVVGSHDYRAAGTYAVTITLKDIYKESVIIDGTAQIAAA